MLQQAEETIPIWAGSTASVIKTGAGTDTIYGGTGVESIDAGSGNDTIYASAGNDIIDGGGDSDTVDYSSSTTGITVTLLDNGATTSVDHNIAGAFTDNLTNIEGIKGSSTVSNNLTGNNMNNTLIGGNQSDIIKGVSGNNYLNGGAGLDTIFAGTGSDTIIGGSADANWLNYTEVLGANVNVNLKAGTATYGSSIDTISQIRNLQMGNGTNIVEGNSDANSFIGGTGIDTLSYSGSSNAVTLNVTSAGAGNSTGDGSDTFVNFENYTLSGNADIVNLSGVFGSTINGGAGSDTASYSSVGSGTSLTVTVNSGNTSATVFDGTKTDTLQNIEKIIGGDGNDTFIVSNVTGINTLDGDAGVNTLQLSGNIDLSSVVLLNFNTINVAAGQTLTIEASQLSGKIVTGTGIVNALNLDAALNANFANVESGITLNVDWSGTGTYTGNLTNVDALTISSGTMTVTDDILGTVPTSGAGNIVVQVDTSSSQSFSNLSLTGTETIQFTGNSTFTGDFANSKIVVNSGVTLTTNFATTLNGKVNVLSGAGNVTLTDINVDASNVDAVAAKISGILTATITTGAVLTTLNAITNVNVSDVITFTTTDTIADASDIVDLKVKVDNFNVDTITTITENAATIGTNAATITSALAITGGIEAVTITGAISAADTNIIANATSGIVTATITSGAVTNTLNAITNVDVNDVITFTTTDTSVDASDLVALKEKVDTLGVNTVTTVTEVYNTASLGTVVVNALNITGNTEAVTITGGTISSADTNTIANATSGIVTATVTADTAANLNTALTNASATDALALTINAGNAKAADLIALDGKTSVAVGATAVTTITGNGGDIKTVLESSGINKAANVNINVDSGTATVAQQIAIDAKTTGTITATIAEGDVTTLKTLTSSGGVHALTIVLTDTSASAADLNTIDLKTSVNVNASSITDITSSAIADVKTLITNKTTAGIGGSWNVVISDTVNAADAKIVNAATSGTINISASTTLNGSTADVLEIVNNTGSIFITASNYATTLSDTASVANANIILGDTSGIVTAVVASDSAANLNTNLANATTGLDALTLTVNGTTASASDLISLDGKTSVVVGATAITTITGNAADIKTVLESTGINKATNVNITITENTPATLAELIAINNATTGTLTLNAESISADYSGNVAGVKAAFNGITTHTGKIEITGGTVNVADINTVAGATSGEVTATVTPGAASILNVLTTNATDAITITVTAEAGAAATQASHLVALNTHTNKAITITAVTSVSGSYADLLDVYVTNAAHYTGEGSEAVTITGGVTATHADEIADATSGIVTATINADTAANLNSALVDSGSQVNAYTLTVNGTSAIASDLIALAAKTSGIITISSTSGFSISMNSGENLNLNGFINNVSGGTLTINDSTGNENIIGTSGNDTINLTTGSDTVNTGSGDDTINIAIDNLDSADTINGGDGNDSLNFSTSGTLTSADVSNISAVENLNFHGGDDVFSFTNETDFASTMARFGSINGGAGVNSIDFSSAVTGDLDFSKLTEFENLNLSSVSDNLIISGDEPTNINGLGGDDQFTLDFSKVSSFKIDGGAGSDTVKINGSYDLANDTNFATNDRFSNIETLDISGMTLTSNNDSEFTFTDGLLSAWTSGTNLNLKLNSSQAEFIKFTGDKTGDTPDAGSVTWDNDGANSISEGTYSLGTKTLTIDFIDVP